MILIQQLYRRGAWGPPAPNWATATAAVGPGGGIDWGGDTFKKSTKPRQTMQSPGRQYKAPTDSAKPPQKYAKTYSTRQRLSILDKDSKILDKDPTYLTRVATNIILTHNIQHLI